MDFCLERFEVGIWSSAREWYMNNALNCIMVGLRGKLLFAWHSILSVPVGQYSSSNTLLIDTDPYKALLNPPKTAIFPTEYKPSDVNDNALEHPFGQPAISPLHPDWNYYSKIIRRNSKTYYK
ncbi:hypothetical protein CISIN_1g039355mg [Citrus sinensis]|uniref:Uncharacterized protein n=1 Tax=Citrus sinensis TaxID=2711 RepID=A0A067FC14_CITSI|nr:hypothetical protein CISIN_1g039355mg [Citrus sinensis]